MELEIPGNESDSDKWIIASWLIDWILIDLQNRHVKRRVEIF